MKDETRVWLSYSEENFKAAQLLLERNIYNPCLQNIQQSIEKALKSILLEKSHCYRKTHSINELVHLLANQQIAISLSEEDCDLLDSIYLPSKYPLGGVLPDFEPDASLCQHCLMLAEEVVSQVRKVVGR